MRSKRKKYFQSSIFKKKDSIISLGVFAVFTFLAIWITFPLLFHLGDYITGYGDELSYSWIYAWVIHSVTSGNIFNLFNTNIFHPYNIALSNSDPNIISSLLALLPFLIIREPIVVVNYTIITSIIMTGFAIYLLAYYLTKDHVAAFFSGLLVMFSPAYLSFYVHLQMFAIAFVPLAILFFLHFLKTGKSFYFIISLLFFVAQTYNNFLAGYFIIASYIIILIFKWFADKKNIRSVFTKKNIVYFIIATALIIPIAIPYISVSREFNYVRDIRDSVHFALQPEDLLFSSPFSRLHSFINDLPFNQVSQNNEFKPGYLGGVFTLITILLLLLVFKNWKKQVMEVKALITIGLTGLVLSLGPVLHLGRHTIHEPFLIPLPYALFYYVIPGFQGFRNSARWEMLFIIGIAVSIAIVLTHMLKKYNFKTKLVIYALLIIACIAEYNFPMKFETVPPVKDFPKVHAWLATTPNDTIFVEMPIYNWNMSPYGVKEFWRMYYSTIHFRRTVNGGGGFTPPPWQEMIYELDSTFPSPNSLMKLRALGVTYVIVHEEEYDVLYEDNFKVNNIRIKNGEAVLNELSKDKKVKKVKQFEKDHIFKL